jgi:hypothetical protein
MSFANTGSFDGSTFNFNYRFMGEFTMRTATPDDLHHILRHRRTMFEELGERDVAILDRLLAMTRLLRLDRLSLLWFGCRRAIYNRH